MRKFLLLSFPLLFFTLATTTASADVWITKNQWNSTWEARYQKWVEENWDKNFFTKDTPYKDLLVDCADAVYSMRYVFAAENGLPFAIKDPSGGSRLITNEMDRWDDKPEDQRKRAFLRYLYGIVSTASIPNDTYPVAVNRNGLTSGIVLLTDRASHHSWTIRYFSETGIPMMIYSSRPAKTVMFQRFEYPTTGFTFPNGLYPETQAGFRAFRQPKDVLKPAWEVPGYSLEQYDIPIDKWARTIQKTLRSRSETAEESITRQLAIVCDGARERIEAVAEALIYLKNVNYRCLNATEYDDLSTPSRDERLYGSFRNLAKTTQAIVDGGKWDKLSSKTQSRLRQIFKGAEGTYCPLQISRSKTISLYEVYTGFLGNRVSSNPHDNLDARWGLTEQSSSLAESCPRY